MDKNEMIRRYIYAVTKRLPLGMRQDVAKELLSVINDMLEERCGEVLPAERDVRVVLTELGTPSELAEKYGPNSGKSLIGPPYYRLYKMLLKIVLPCFVFGLTMATVIGAIADRPVWYMAVGGWLGGMFSGGLICFAIVTLIFAGLEYKGVKIDEDAFSLDNLPPIPEKRRNVKKGEAIAGIALILVFCAVFLTVPRIISVYFAGQGRFIPVFDAEALSGAAFVVLAFGVMGIIRQCVLLLEGDYTVKALIVTLAADLTSILLALLWLGSSSLLNPEFTTALTAVFAGEAELAWFVPNIQYIFLGVIIFALVLDMATAFVRTLKTRA